MNSLFCSHSPPTTRGRHHSCFCLFDFLSLDCAPELSSTNQSPNVRPCCSLAGLGLSLLLVWSYTVALPLCDWWFRVNIWVLTIFLHPSFAITENSQSIFVCCLKSRDYSVSAYKIINHVMVIVTEITFFSFLMFLMCICMTLCLITWLVDWITAHMLMYRCS